MKVGVLVLSSIMITGATLSVSAQKGSKNGGPRKVELPHPFYWAAFELLGDWR